MNHVFLTGRIGKIEERFTASGVRVASIRLAVTKKVKDEFETHWIDVSAFDSAAQRALDAGKGVMVVLSGSLQENSWENKQGEKRSKVTITAKEIRALEKYTGGGEGSKTTQHQEPAFNNEDIPF